LLSANSLCFGQKKINIAGFFNQNDTSETSKKTASVIVLIKMIVDDAVYQSTFINDEGFFEFYKPCSNKNYKLEFSCYGYSFRPTIRIKENEGDKIVIDCQFNIIHFTDSIFKSKDFKFPKCLTYDYCGYPAYSDRKLGFYSNKYGFRYENMGCYAFDEKKVNEEAIKKLNKSLGDNWEEVFRKEIELKLK